MDSEGEGEGGMIWENGIETCILSGKKKETVYVSYSYVESGCKRSKDMSLEGNAGQLRDFLKAR